MNIPLQQTLAAGRSASEQKFATALVSRSQQAYDAQLAALQKTLQQADDTTAARIADLQAAVGVVSALAQAQTDAATGLRDLVQTESDENQKLLDGVEAARKETAQQVVDLQSQINNGLADVIKRLDAFSTQQSRQIGTWSWHVGDPAWLQVPDCIVCDGREIYREAAPDLAAALGDAFGVPSDGRCFKLPSKAQLTSVTFLLNHAAIWPWIRYR